MEKIYELVKLSEDEYDTNGGYPVETTIGYYSTREKAEEAWERFKKTEFYEDWNSNVEAVSGSGLLGHDIYEIALDCSSYGI